MRNLILLCKQIHEGTGSDSTKKDKNQGWFFSDGMYHNGIQEDGSFSITHDGKHSGCIIPSEVFLSVEHFRRSGEFCIVTKSGDFNLWNPQNDSPEYVASYGDSIWGMFWSPEQEICVIATDAGKIILMDALFDLIEEVNLLENTFGDKEFVILGWGKKETQFHGSAGKKAAQMKENTECVLDETLSPKINVVWRGDGEYFAVNFLREGQRLFKVFSRDGKLQYTSEKCPGLEEPIAWKPSGLWIAVPQNLPDKYVIALFEKNGLRHRELCLPFKRENEIVCDLKWSNDSTVLAILTTTNNQSNIYLYTLGNYQWYLKQCLRFETSVLRFDWDSSLNECKSLYVLLDTGSTHTYSWKYDINCSAGQTEADESIVGVIEGRNVLLTNFRGVVVPPPMCAFTLTCDDYVNTLGFIQNPTDPRESNKFFTVTNTNLLTFYECKLENGHIKNCTEIGKLNLKEIFHIYNSIHWLSEDFLLVDAPTEKSSLLYCLQKKCDQWDKVDKIPLKDFIVGITSFNESSLVISLLNKTLFKLKVNNGEFSDVEEFTTLPEFCEKTVAVKVDEKETIFSLQMRQSLYNNGDKIHEGVTSFVIVHPFLVYTTLDELTIVNLHQMNVVMARKMERGGRIVTIVPQHDRTVLQMPRGNLEVIQPRALTLLIVGNLLDKNEYRKAYEILRKQRINLNLIVDHNPREFLDKIDIFLREITNPTWLNLFLTDLQAEDVTTTIYEGSYKMQKGRDYPENYTIENKVEIICQQMCQMMESMEEKRFTLPIITSFVKRMDIESALRIIARIRDVEKASEQPTFEAEDALNYLLYLVDVNKLYDIALGMYDFKLVLFVAEKSQKDPKEYIAHLNELNQFEESYRRYKIDLHLKRYERALENISKCPGKFDECLKLIKDRHLYAKALTHFPPNSQEYQEIAKAYADHLRYRGFLEEASMMYERSGDLEAASQTAKNTLDFHRCLLLKKKSGASDTELGELLQTLIPSMKENGMYREAADLMRIHLWDQQQMIEILLEGKLYMAAINEWNGSNYYTLEHMQAHLQSYTEVLMDCMQRDRMQFVNYKMRLNAIRTKRMNEPHIDAAYFDDCDLYSDTTSVSKFTGSSYGTSKTHKSSKNRRKQKRKQYSLKEGNPFEDVALIDALYNLVIKCFGQQQQIKEICKATIMLSIDEMGKKLQHYYKNLLHTIELSLDEIWIPNDIRFEIVEPHKRIKPHLMQINWEYEVFK